MSGEQSQGFADGSEEHKRDPAATTTSFHVCRSSSESSTDLSGEQSQASADGLEMSAGDFSEDQKEKDRPN